MYRLQRSWWPNVNMNSPFYNYDNNKNVTKQNERKKYAEKKYILFFNKIYLLKLPIY